MQEINSNSLLEISIEAPNELSGGGMGIKRNNWCLQKIFGKKISYIQCKTLNSDTVLEKIYRNYSKLVRKSDFANEKEILSQAQQYNYVFIEGARLGRIAKKLKRMGYKGRIIFYFHNFEYKLAQDDSMGLNFVIRYIYMRMVKCNEKEALKYGDVFIFINERDKVAIEKEYGNISKHFSFIPPSIEDQLSKHHKELVANDKPIYTFLGSYFYPNVHGILWFIENVYPHVNIRLRIVGRGMNKLKEVIKSSDIEILSDVPDLSRLIENTDYMLYPIFYGSGMKIKTCEALMYGKNIIGTDEAFCGYNIDDYSKVGALCNTADEFIKTIRTINKPRFNEYSRDVYLNNYTLEQALALFKNFFEEL